jgi:plasmid stabilization system protein ParE
MARAFEWYQEQRPGLGREFMDAVGVTLAQINENPGLFAVHRERIRRTTTRRFPYPIFYVVDPDESVVIAVFHASRDPRLWP